MEDKTKSFFLLNRAFRYYRTLRYLRFKQVFYRVYYPLKRKFYRSPAVSDERLMAALQHPPLHLPKVQMSETPDYSPEHNTFTFLNQSKSFGAAVDWKFREYGLLWSFHLHYFDWLNHDEVTTSNGLGIINQYIDNHVDGYVSSHSFVLSYRLVSWTRFCLERNINDLGIIKEIYKIADRLAAFPEYELMGNHLLENGIALAWAGVFFREKRFLVQGREILSQQLKEQILADGAHFEKSVSYHTILLKRLIQFTTAYQVLQGEDDFYNYLILNLSKMLSHVFVLSETRQFLPSFGDGNQESLVNVGDLTSMARNLPIHIYRLPLGESGFRKLQAGGFTLFFNLGNIPASYQPGHAHADAFTFCLNVNGFPLIVDRGVSTYEVGPVRKMERATTGHNTISVCGADCSEVWAAFRMGKRVKTEWLDDQHETIDCQHDGYFDSYKIMHRRTIRCEGERIIIEDHLRGWKGEEAEINYHFYPGLEPVCLENGIWYIEKKNVSIKCEGATFSINNYQYAKGFNHTVPAKRLTGKIYKEIIVTVIERR